MSNRPTLPKPDFSFIASSGNAAVVYIRTEGDRRHVMIIWKRESTAEDRREFEISYTQETKDRIIASTVGGSTKRCLEQGEVYLKGGDITLDEGQRIGESGELKN